MIPLSINQRGRLPLLAVGSRFAFVWLDGVQHDFVRVLRRVMCIALAPIITDGVCENGSGVVEGCCRNGTTDFRISLETMLGVFVPEVKSAVAARGTKGAMYGVEGNGVDRIDICDVALVRHILTVTFEREVRARAGH